MRRLLAAALAAPLAAVALAAPAATAGGADSRHDGRCAFYPVNQHQATGWGQAGTLAAVVTLRSEEPAGNPVTATVTCEVRVNAVPQPFASASATGTGAVVVLDDAAFSPDDDDLVEVCTVVDFADATPTATECVPMRTVQIPPRFVFDAVTAVQSEVWAVVDPRLCPLIAALAPGHGDVVVNDQGDVYAGGEPVWDCPPYDVVWD